MDVPFYWMKKLEPDFSFAVIRQLLSLNCYSKMKNLLA